MDQRATRTATLQCPSLTARALLPSAWETAHHSLIARIAVSWFTTIIVSISVSWHDTSYGRIIVGSALYLTPIYTCTCTIHEPKLILPLVQSLVPSDSRPTGTPTSLLSTGPPKPSTSTDISSVSLPLYVSLPPTCQRTFTPKTESRREF